MSLAIGGQNKMQTFFSCPEMSGYYTSFCTLHVNTNSHKVLKKSCYGHCLFGLVTLKNSMPISANSWIYVQQHAPPLFVCPPHTQG